MRTIKFRAWDNELKKYFKPTYEAYKGNLEDLHISLSGRLGRRTLKHCMEDESRFEGKYILEQYTGLKDKNGKEIYEGDIIEFQANYTNKECGYMNGVIEWDNENCKYHLNVKGLIYDIENETYEWYYKREIIGNIHENPELL